MPIAERSPAERSADLDRTLAAAPADLRTEKAWLFVYGSMLEEPPFAKVGSRTLTLPGWSRRFCIADPKIRGTEASPGLTLGLVEGGACDGVAWSLPSDALRDALDAVWQGEMRLPMYVGAWLRVPGVTGPVLTLMADIRSPLFQPDLTEEAVSTRLARCAGEKGPNRDYLDEVVRGLAAHGLSDPYLDALRSVTA